ncbi:MAG: putative quinol monooxygenase [Paracoccus sp. (in: a-proteobacteria)]|uniref:putative quinol monooxygenase n=1 Tax=Paracoccus sp. TaxID=267 RepID=UPI0026DFF6ED|nr:putative quinol monooxygenase [Paracoccus sp. (in: a-proteobacteria)]MDO5622699.1 putative quinol monooxygenase [Paracoccus sp. (in: a-proteobacteria)]
MKALILAALLTLPFTAQAEETPMPPILRIFEFTVAPEDMETFMAAGRDNIRNAIRDEPGVLSMSVAADASDPTRLYVVETYRDEAAYQAHRDTPHFQAFIAAMDGKFLSRRVIETTPAMLGAKPFEWGMD